MRQPVPFIGEELLIRGEDSEGDTHGRLLDDILSTEGNESSWDEIASNWPSRASTPEPHASVTKATTPKPQPKSKPTPPKPKTPLAKAVSASHMEWIPINNGHGLRINVTGNMDLQLRKQWQQLLRETSASNIGQFEFNLAQAPELGLTGLGMLLLFKDQKKSQRQDIKLCHCSPRVRELLHWTGMDKYFVIQGVAKPTE